MKIVFISDFNKKIIIIILLIISILTSSSFAKNLVYRKISIQEKLDNIKERDEKIAYLTFDDGPSKKETSKILDILKKYNIKATFFVIGKNVKEYPNLVKREYDEGHYIANHTYSHDNYILYKNKENFINEIKQTDMEISNALGIENYSSHIFRFPNGYMSKIYMKQKKQYIKELEKMNYGYVDWNCLNRDSEIKISKYQLLKNLKETSKNKNNLIVLMHDTGDVNNSSEVLEESILYLKNEGYIFKNMYEIINNKNLRI